MRQGVCRATLTRKGRVYATGKLPSKLHTRRAVLAGNYTLKVAGKTYPALVAQGKRRHRPARYAVTRLRQTARTRQPGTVR